MFKETPLSLNNRVLIRHVGRGVGEVDPVR